jgi:ParB family chromosome partitioning protein
MDETKLTPEAPKSAAPAAPTETAAPAAGPNAPAGATTQAATGGSPASAGASNDSKIKTRQGSGYLKQLYSTARTTASSTHTNLKSLTTFLVNFVPVDKVDASELQVRVHFDDAEIAALAHSVKSHGVLQPVLVVQDGDRYKVIAGERRLRAAKLAGLDRIPARVLSTDDKATHEIALRENLDRVDLHPLEEGEGYVSLLETGAYTSHEGIAKGFGKPKSRITECIGFTRLPETTKAELMAMNVKNRALLRTLLAAPVEQHADLILEAAGKEEVLDANLPAVAGEAGAKAPKQAKPVKPFEYKCDEKVVSVPSFKWKSTDDSEKLRVYATAIKQLLSQIEAKLTP